MRVPDVGHEMKSLRCLSTSRRAQANRVLHRLLTLVLSSALLLGSGGMLHADDLQGYRLSSGDKVRIAVFGEDDLTVTGEVSDRGTISFPLLGELKVAGLTPGALESLVAGRLRGPYLVDPRVTVSIEAYRQFFVMGQVNKPGSYAYLPGLTVRKAISIAGGYTERASRKNTFVVPEAQSTQERRVGQDDQIGPGDTIVVKESFF
ncbi:MAG TPA: polysaccharide biosynthesis/export family protein [Lamprocystis sp. (in: g-proteobacteria)]|nr:polysaccharide biosynthesis/export family protein [Lamprocystis sp. (in: g-proteobacteria)]